MLGELSPSRTDNRDEEEEELEERSPEPDPRSDTVAHHQLSMELLCSDKRAVRRRMAQEMTDKLQEQRMKRRNMGK